MNTTVLIVGEGPAGLTLACELTRYRVPVRIVDKAPQRTDKSKAIVLWSPHARASRPRGSRVVALR